MTRQSGPWINEQHLLQGAPANSTLVENVPRQIATSNGSALTTQVMTTVALPLNAGDVVSSLTFVSATTAANTPTNWWFALYSPAGALLAQTADQTNTAWAANTAMKVALSSAQLITTPGVYYAGIMVKATTPPTLHSVGLASAVMAGALGLSMKVLAQTSDSALTTTAPATIGTPTTIAVVPYVVAS